MKRALRRAATSRRILVLSALLITVAAPVGGTWAYFNASTVNSTSALGGGWVGEATTSPVDVSGLDAVLSWTKTTHADAITAQTLYAVDRSSTANCTGATFSGAGTSVGTGSTYTAGPNTNGHYYCFKLVEADNNWLSQGVVFPVAHLGLFPTTVAVDSGGRSAQGSDNDTITITFNQPISNTGLPANGATIDVCFISSRIILGDTAGCSTSSDANTIGVITGFSFSGSFNANTSTISLAPATNPTTLTITLHTTGNGANSHSNTITGTGTYTAKSSIATAATTHSTTVCTSSTFGCTPSVANGF